MQYESNFECLSFDLFSLQENLMNNECDPDVNFYQNNVSNVEANYFLMTEVKSSLASFVPNPFSVLHLNIRSMKKNFEIFKEFLKNVSVSFSAIFLSETWCESRDELQNSNYILSSYNFFYQYRQYRRGGGVCLFVKESFCCKTRQDLSINCDAIELLCLEIANEKSKNIILNLTYRPPNRDVKEFEKHLNKILSTNEILKKEVIMAGDFNMNLLDFEQNKKVKNFLNIMFGHSMFPVINKPPRVTKNTATAIDHIFISSVTTTKFKTGIIKSDISDHFPIFFVAEYNIHIKKTKERFIFRRDLSDIFVEKFKYKLRTVSWESFTNSSDTNKAYDNFIEIFSSVYDECFPKKKIKLKAQKYNSPWITKGIKKSSKKTQKLYEKFLKNRNEKNEKLYKSYKSLFESVKRKSKRIYFSSKILEFKNKAKKTWGVMKEQIGKAGNTESSLPIKLAIEKKEVVF